VYIKVVVSYKKIYGLESSACIGLVFNFFLDNNDFTALLIIFAAN